MHARPAQATRPALPLRLPPPQKSASRREMGEVAVSAAESAYDRVADLEREQQLRTQGLSASGSSETMYYASGEAVQAVQAGRTGML